MTKFIKLTTLFFSGLLLLACNDTSNSIPKIDASHFKSNNTCHVYGVATTKLSSSKEQADKSSSQSIKKFCSTREMLEWYLQPENKSNVIEMYIRDMGKVDWENPNNEHIVSARDAFFVINSNKDSSKDVTIMTFLKDIDAGEYMKKHGGTIISFNGLTLDSIKITD